jgi:uncharacterized membrane protein (UPF0127 family)
MMHIAKKYPVYAYTTVFVAALCFFGWLVWDEMHSTTPPPGTVMIVLGTTPVRVEIADSPEERQRGLSGRQVLPEGTGMLFVMPTEGYPSVWMPDMYVALDVIWMDSSLKVVYIKEDVRPDTYPATFGPDAPARYFLEVPSGFVQKNNITLGAEMRFE